MKFVIGVKIIEWVWCKDCIFFQEGDCENFFINCDGCYFGITDEDIENEEVAAASSETV